MSKFFKGAISSSESSESDLSDNEAPAISSQQRPTVRDFAYPSDSDDEGPKRVVRTQKDKMYAELKEQIRVARNARNIKDISKLLTTFELLCKVFDKTQAVMTREGLTIPRFYIRALVEVEDFTKEQWEDKESRSTLSKVHAKSLSSLRQKIRKYNKDFEAEIAAYKDGPDPVGYSSGGEAIRDEDEEPVAGGKVIPVQPASKEDGRKQRVSVRSGGDSSDEDAEWKSETDESSESDIDIEGKQMEDLRKFFLKKEKTPKERKERDVRRNKEARGPKESEDEEANEEEWQRIGHKDDASRPLFDPKTEINAEAVIKKLGEINSGRGKRSTNRKAHVRYLQELYRLTDENGLGEGLLAKILFSVISSLLEMNSKVNEAMEFTAWCKCAETVEGFLAMLAEHSNVILSLLINEEEENLSDADKPYTVRGSVMLTVKRLDEELTKIFQHADCHSTEYISKLKGEKDLCRLIEKTQSYFESRKETGLMDVNEMIAVYMLRIEHLYYKYSQDEVEGEKEMDALCKVIYAKKEAAQQRQRALLCQIYHHALHDRYQKARSLLLMSHLQAIVDHSDPYTQVLFNRTICQIGLCAFRHGLIREAHTSLSDIQNTQRSKEVLAQGIPPRQGTERTPEQELKERSMQVPFHMHINLELMECTYLICCMLLEIPTVACHEYDLRRRILSRSFHYQLKFSEKSALIGPPENTREHVVAAARAMLKGDWRKCRDYVINDKMCTKVWNLFRNSETVKEMIIKRIQEETLRTYLLMYSTIYSTVSVSMLCDLFELDKQRIYSLISKMILQEELAASLDEQSDCIIIHRVEPSRLQLLSLSATEKLTQFVDNNEQTVEPRANVIGRTTYNLFQRGQQGQEGQRGQGGDEKTRRVGFHMDRRGQGAGGQHDGQQKRQWKGQHYQQGGYQPGGGIIRRQQYEQKIRF